MNAPKASQSPLRLDCARRVRRRRSGLVDVALSEPGVQRYYAEALRSLVPRHILPEALPPEPERETAILAERAGKAAGLNPQDIEGHFLRSNALYLDKRYEESLEALDRALELRPNFPEALSNRS